MESETIGRIVLIPPKGILEKLRGAIVSKFNGGEIRYAKDIELPPARFDVELFVDDDCEVCPYAVELLAELSSRFNVYGKIYNLTYVEPPKDLVITATPVFRINSVVKFAGIPLPLDVPQAKGFIEEKFREAYIRSHPKLHELTERLRTYAEAHGYRRNPSDMAYMNLIYRLLLNIDRYGYPFCPCRQLKRVEGATPQQIAELNKDKICPCIYAPMDIAKMGHCLCVPPDTIILGENKPIVEYSVGDYTLVGGRVVRTWKRWYEGDIVVIKGMGLIPLRLTPEHPVLAIEVKWENGRRKVSEPAFVPAIELRPAPSRRRLGKGHYLLIPTVDGLHSLDAIDLAPYIKKYGHQNKIPKKFPLNRETAWLLGLYVADGSLRPTWRGKNGYNYIIQIALSKGEQEYIKKATKIIEELGLTPRIEEVKNENCVYVLVQSAVIARMFEQLFGRRSEEKKIPDIITLHRDKDVLEGFLEGLIAGDGFKLNATTDIIVTSSPYIALASQLISYRLGYVSHIYITHRKPHKLGNRVIKPKHPIYAVYIYRSRKSNKILRLGKYVAVPITNVGIHPYKGYVYNLTTENNVYLVSNVVVHNCGMFWSKEKVEEYVRQRLEKYGWMIKEIEDVQKILEEAKKRIVSGRMREAIETAINILQNVYASAPD